MLEVTKLTTKNVGDGTNDVDHGQCTNVIWQLKQDIKISFSHLTVAFTATHKSGEFRKTELFTRD